MPATAASDHDLSTAARSLKLFVDLGFSTDGTYSSVMKLDCERMGMYIQGIKLYYFFRRHIF